MALEKKSVIDRIEVLERGIIQIRTANRILEDGKILSQSYHRTSLAPRAYLGELLDAEGQVATPGTWSDTDISGEDPQVQAIANANWTDEVKAAYEAGI